MSNVTIAENLVIQTRINLLRDSKVAWLVTLLLSAVTKVSKVTDCGHEVKTLCVDSKYFYIDPDFFTSLDPKYRKSAFLHEALHLGLKHVLRYIDFSNHEKYNRACDYIVNAMIVRLGYPVSPSWLYDTKYTNWSLINIYNDLPDEPSDMNDSNSLTGCMYKPTTQDQVPDIEGRIYAAEQILKGDPTAYSQVKDLFGDFQAATTNPIPFQTVLSDYLDTLTKDCPTWKHLNRRQFAAGLTMKGYGFGSLRSAVVAFDASGSMSEEQKAQTIQQVEYMRDVLQIQELHLLVFDDKLQNSIKIDQGTPVSTYELHGGGGTQLNCVFEYIEEHMLCPELLMVFTDMALHLPPKPMYPLLWVGIQPCSYWVDKHLNDPVFYGRYVELA